MSYTVTSGILEILWDSLNERPKSYNPFKVEKLFSEIAEKGWATFSDVEDIFCLTDERLDKRQLYLSDLCESFGIHIEDAFYKPSAKGNSTTGFESIRSEDVALLVITLEKLGFEIDATLLVDMLLPSLKSRKKRIFSNSELQVFWYKRYRHKYPSITLSVKDWFNRNYSTNQIKTRLGYKLTVKIDEEGKPVYLEVSSPKFRNRPEPVEVTCSDCGHNWQKGDPDSSAAHRKIHRRRMAYLNPQPLPLLIQERFVNKDFELVTASSPKWKHKEIYERAYAFKREMGFDFVQWKSPNGDNDPYVHGFLITNDAGTITGACSFRRKIFDNEPRWCLDWVWICPKERRNGHLSKRWKTYRQRFGNFFLSPPVSEMMQDFLNQHGETSY